MNARSPMARRTVVNASVVALSVVTLLSGALLSASAHAAPPGASAGAHAHAGNSAKKATRKAAGRVTKPPPPRPSPAPSPVPPSPPPSALAVAPAAPAAPAPAAPAAPAAPSPAPSAPSASSVPPASAAPQPAPVTFGGAFDGASPDRPSSLPDPIQRRVALTLNPLGAIVGRYGGNIEILAAPHHAIVASAYWQTFSTTMLKIVLPSAELGDGPASRLGGELGYRFYASREAPSGLFVGPSLVAMPIAYPRVTEQLRAEVVSFHAYGAALDVGAQIVTGSGFTFGGGVGVMALAYTPPASVAPPPGVEVPSYPEPHVLPRLLLAAGWAF